MAALQRRLLVHARLNLGRVPGKAGTLGVALRRRFSDAPAVQDAVATGEEFEPPWLALREATASRSASSSAAKELVAKLKPSENLLVAPTEDVLLEGAALAYSGRATVETLQRWRALTEQLLTLELSAEQAFLVFHYIVKIGDFEPKMLKKLLEKVVDRIECQYFSMELTLDYDTLGRTTKALETLGTILRAFPVDDQESFQSLVNLLPLDHKVQLILLHSRRLPRGEKLVMPKIREPLIKDAKREWKTMDPVEMEEWERERYFKGRIRVPRMPHVEAKIRKTPPGKRLRAMLASQLFQVLPTADAATLAEISQVCFFPQRLLTGDLQLDFQEALAKRIASLNRHQLLPYILCFAAALRACEGPEAYRTLRKRLLPDLLWLLRAEKRREILQNQRFVLPLLQLNGREGVQHELAEHTARLMISVCGARQIQMDVEMMDVLSQPLEEALADGLQLQGDGEVGQSILSTETLGDLLSALVTCKVQPRPELMELLLEVVKRGGADLWKRNSDDADEGGYGPLGDLCVTAHGLSLLHGNCEVALQQLWENALPWLGPEAPVALLLQLLDALLRGASDDLVMSESVRSAFDEFVVQRVDLDSSALGHIGV